MHKVWASKSSTVGVHEHKIRTCAYGKYTIEFSKQVKSFLFNGLLFLLPSNDNKHNRKIRKKFQISGKIAHLEQLNLFSGTWRDPMIYFQCMLIFVIDVRALKSKWRIACRKEWNHRWGSEHLTNLMIFHPITSIFLLLNCVTKKCYFFPEWLELKFQKKTFFFMILWKNTFTAN